MKDILFGEKPKFSLEQILPALGNLQDRMTQRNIESFIAGGVGLDLLALKYIPDHQPRNHKDVDIYIRDIRKGVFVELLNELGVKINYTAGDFPYYSHINYKDIPYDVLSYWGSEDHGFYINQLLLGQPVSSMLFKINPDPEIVTFRGHDFKVLDVQSQLKMSRGTNVGDRELIKRINRLLNP